MWLSQLIDTEGLMPHGMCYLWDPGLLWTHVLSDVLIGISYVAISVTLAWLVWRSMQERVDHAGPLARLPFWWMFLAFGLFIVACGVTHFLGAWTVWNPDYWVSGGAKVVTALASMATAVALPPLVPRALRLVREARESEIRKREMEEAHRELKKAHAQIRELDELKTSFFANVSHELRTPLTLITGPVERMLARSDLSGEERRDLDVVLRNARILHKHVDDLLDLTRLEAEGLRPRPRRVDLARVVRRVSGNFDGLAADMDIRFVVDAEGALPAELDPDQIERVVLNLLSNAFKFTPPGGTVRIDLDTEDMENAEYARESDDAEGAGPERRVRLRVADSGPGVPPDMREAVFERFRQVEGGPDRAFGGTGLGLTIAREFVGLHGGRIDISDAPEGGALFTVTLPVGPDASVGAPVGEGSEESGGEGEEGDAEHDRRVAGTTEVVVESLRGGGPGRDPGPERATPAGRPASTADAPTVLVVEDNQELGRFLLDTLPVGVRGMLAADGEEALELARRDPPDVIVSDLMMPGMTGRRLLEVVRESEDLEQIPFIVLTARADQELRTEMLEKGAQDYITKPFSAPEVEARVGNWVTVARARRTLQERLDVREQNLETLAGNLSEQSRELGSALEAAMVAREEEALANQAKSEFLSVMSHELRTPLTAIVGYTDLLLEEISGPINDEQRRQLDRLQKSSEHLLGLIEQTLDFSHMEREEMAPRMESVDMGALLEEVEILVASFAEESGLDLVLEGTRDVAPLRTDPGRVRQILTNLLSNAVKYTDEGFVRATIRDEGDVLRVVVEDTGIGIDPKYSQKIFEPFWQVDQSSTRGAGGTGLGLSIARKLARRLGGDVTFTPREGGGSVFTLTLPRHAE